MNKLSPAIKGMITAILMMAVFIVISVAGKSVNPSVQYLVYAIYISGILWTLLAFRSKDTVNSNFKTYFAQGFKSFIVVTLLMVGFTYFFLKMNPHLKEEMGKNYKIELNKTGDKTSAEIDAEVQRAKDFYVTMNVQASVFRYLIIGGLVTLIASGFLSQNSSQYNSRTKS